MTTDWEERENIILQGKVMGNWGLKENRKGEVLKKKGLRLKRGLGGETKAFL